MINKKFQFGVKQCRRVRFISNSSPYFKFDIYDHYLNGNQIKTFSLLLTKDFNLHLKKNKLSSLLILVSKSQQNASSIF